MCACTCAAFAHGSPHLEDCLARKCSSPLKITPYLVLEVLSQLTCFSGIQTSLKASETSASSGRQVFVQHSPCTACLPPVWDLFSVRLDLY